MAETNASMLVEGMSRNIFFPSFECQKFYVLYPAVTYLLALPYDLYTENLYAKGSPTEMFTHKCRALSTTPYSHGNV